VTARIILGPLLRSCSTTTFVDDLIVIISNN